MNGLRHIVRVVRGLSLVETTISLVVVGGLTVAALNTVSATAVSRRTASDRANAACVAQALAAEIVALAYDDPLGDDPALGPSAAETATGNRSLFDDVDDYAGLVENPPLARDGSGLGLNKTWSMKTDVVWADATDPNQTAGAETGIKRIEIALSRSGVVVYRWVALRTRTADAAGKPS